MQQSLDYRQITLECPCLAIDNPGAFPVYCVVSVYLPQMKYTFILSKLLGVASTVSWCLAPLLLPIRLQLAQKFRAFLFMNPHLLTEYGTR